ncbi:MAG: hypothetical protein US72_C0002G0005 [Microgenomates group bacterium GW2011_GWC1_38_12]|uniref:DUF4382 domain-containing protein n=1 Tax=Candidatus Vogelbacteria bacterium RIFOXYB1_FULL_42_16 TaxID=1802436 RepID=A0A1G2QGM3_9BACT|nr:MAG: hypothetical protein US72_C0002G0005 [Microgenomates group bacterium GW2011_GWC1_38_12]KKS78111.1 MAG: hypothetical protein UV50_C0001G0021 [Parcubacteria group bacterium GW2011_GWB1_42_9]OHA59162.1 MAG: hypothetical protein A2370_03175 [Candidatus Vogelbacteria bacterium RIFOXYB1_FULL_42_16]
MKKLVVLVLMALLVGGCSLSGCPKETLKVTVTDDLGLTIEIKDFGQVVDVVGDVRLDITGLKLEQLHNLQQIIQVEIYDVTDVLTSKTWEERDLWAIGAAFFLGTGVWDIIFRDDDESEGEEVTSLSQVIELRPGQQVQVTITWTDGSRDAMTFYLRNTEYVDEGEGEGQEGEAQEGEIVPPAMSVTITSPAPGSVFSVASQAQVRVVPDGDPSAGPYRLMIRNAELVTRQEENVQLGATYVFNFTLNLKGSGFFTAYLANSNGHSVTAYSAYSVR